MKIRTSRRDYNAFPLPLFTWADARDRWQSVATPVRVIARRHGLSLRRAVLVAEFLGLRDDR